MNAECKMYTPLYVVSDLKMQINRHARNSINVCTVKLLLVIVKHLATRATEQG